MHKFINFILVVTVLTSGFLLYSLEHRMRGAERDIAAAERGIDAEIENMRFLSAEWSSLTRPDRLKKLAEQHLGLTTLKAQQIVTLSELGQKVPAEPIVKLEAKGADPIGAIIDKMQ